MGNYTNAWEAKINDKLWGGTDFTPPATVYFGFSLTEPAEDGTNITEPAGNNYARAAVTNNATNFPSGNPKTCATPVVFPEPSGPGWGTPGWWFAADHATNVGAAIITKDAIVPPVTIGPNSSPRWAAGTITLSQD